MSAEKHEYREDCTPTESARMMGDHEDVRYFR